MVSGHPAIGALLVVAGMALVVFDVRSLRRTARPAARLGRVRGTTWAAMALAAAAGVLAGAGPHTRAVVAAVVVVAAIGALLCRPQLVLLAVAAFPWLDWFARSYMGGLGPLWDDALLVGGVALIVWSVLVLGRDVPRSVPVSLPILVMVAVSLGSIVLNRVPNGPAVYALRVLFEPILFYFIGFLIPKDRRWVRWTVTVFVLSATLLAVHGLYQFVTHAPMPGNWVDVTETSIVTRAFSVVQNPNVLGGILAMSALVTGSLAVTRSTSGDRRLLLAAACILQLGGLAVTFSRGAWIGFVVALVAMAVLAYRRYLIAMFAAAVVVWFAAPATFTQRLLFSFSSAYAAKSATGLGRVWRWQAALEHIADKPLFGVGLGTFGGTAAYMWGYWDIWVDNFYLQMAAEGGLLLLAAFVWLLIRSAKGLVRSHALASDPYLKALAAGVFGAFVALVVADVFEADWETLSVSVAFWFLAGLATSAVLVRPRSAGEQGGGPVGAPEGAAPGGAAAAPGAGEDGC